MFARWAARTTLLMLFVFALGVVGSTVLVPERAYAEPRPAHNQTADECDKPKLLGVFVPWYQYLTVEKDDTDSCAVTDFTLLPNDGKSSDIPLVLLAVVDDLLRFAGLVAVIFVIYGGVQYATSQGSPDATAKAQSTIMNALIGLAIAVVAVTFVTFLGRTIS